jgi:hypothetical protein
MKKRDMKRKRSLNTGSSIMALASPQNRRKGNMEVPVEVYKEAVVRKT